MSGSTVSFVAVHHRRPLVWQARLIELNSNPIYQIRRFAEDAMCLDDMDVSKLSRFPIRKMHVIIGDSMRVLRKMVLAITPQQRFVYIDRGTGTMYDTITGICKSSLNIRIEPGDLA